MDFFTQPSAMGETRIFQVNKLKFINKIGACWDYQEPHRFIA